MWFSDPDSVDEDASVSIYAVMDVLKSMGPNLGPPYLNSRQNYNKDHAKAL
jgi:hypothetical protein